MFIKEEGVYLALCAEYVMIFRAVGTYPFFRIPSGIVLNEVLIGGSMETQVVNERSVEIQGLIANPELYSITRLNCLAEAGLKGFSKEVLECPELSADSKDEEYLALLEDIDRPHSGLYINHLVTRIARDKLFSVPQAHLYIKELRCILKKRKEPHGKKY